jgi:site-specific recombinase XerC
MSARPKLRLVPTGKWVATNQKYLQWLDTQGCWRFRRVVPLNLRETIGKTEWTERLKARSENEAIRLMLPHIQETDRIIALAEAGNWPPVPDEDVELLARAWWNGGEGTRTLASAEIPRSVERFLVGPRELSGWYERGRMLEQDGVKIRAILDDPKRNASLRRNRDAMHRLLHECRRFRAVFAVEHGEVMPFDVTTRSIDIQLVQPVARALPAPPIDATPARVFPPLSLGGTEAPDKSDLVSRWAKEANPDPRWLYQTRLSMKRFAALVELDQDDATQVTKAEVIRFKEKLDEKGLKSPTINRYLSEIKGPFEWAFKNEKIGTNPAEGVSFARKPRGKSKRRGYTDEQARTILLAARDEDKPYRRWIPWVCAFAGTRLDEVAGRNVSDIEKVGSYFVLNIPEPEDDDDGSVHVKNDGSVRRVPLHPVLVAEGFIDEYVDKLPQDGPLFPDLKPDRFDRRAGTATKEIGRWLRRVQKDLGVLLVDETRYAPNHSWRHRFKSEARRVRMEEEVHDALTGHREGKVSRDYGEYYVNDVLGPAIDSMISPFDLPSQRSS